MASLQTRGSVYRILFRYAGRQYTFKIGQVTVAEARQWKSRTEQLLMREEQGLLQIPPGVSILDFVRSDGKPPQPRTAESPAQAQLTIHQLFKNYLANVSNGAIEKNTLKTVTIHFRHLEKTLGKSLLASAITLEVLQKHIGLRSPQAGPITIKKELDSFRIAWNWGMRMKWIDFPFPSRGLVYPKSEEKLPYMTWDEIQRRIKAGGKPDKLWECLFLDVSQVNALLEHVKSSPAPPWVYPMVSVAAYTGARKSELIRMLAEDVDLEGGVITLREKKRARGTRTSRRVPISPRLAAILEPLMAIPRDGKPYLFGEGSNPLSTQMVHKGLEKALKDSPWKVLRGWHTLRHSFISACASKGIDQRLIDEWVGHQTDQQRIRYRHLYPNVQKAAIKEVFG